jgi:hypothetical protein
MEIKNKYYVYAHLKKTNGECFYIGKGTRDRYKNKVGRNQHWNNINNKYGFEPIILINNISEEKAFELESIICKQIGYENLCNIRTESGWGGYSMSTQTKQKISKSTTGKVRTKQTKQKISESNTGKVRTEQVKQKISYSLKNRSKKEKNKHYSTVSQKLKGRKITQKHKDNISKANKNKSKPKGFGEKISKATKGRIIPQHQIEAGIEARNKITLQYDKQGNFIKEHPSAKIAAESVGITSINMYMHLAGKYKTCKGFIFKYKE